MSEETEEHSAAYHALCKKVAQVTKIISFLVARNEDVEHEKQWLDQHFQSVVGKFEIERDELMRQLREGPMRSSDAGESSGIDATTMIRTLSKQHETDKKQAIGEFNHPVKTHFRNRNQGLFGALWPGWAAQPRTCESYYPAGDHDQYLADQRSPNV